MEQIFWLIFVHKVKEALEAAVTEVRTVPDSERRGMGHKDVQITSVLPLVAHQTQCQTADSASHLGFRVLTVPVVVAHGAPKACDQKTCPFVPHALSVQDEAVELLVGCLQDKDPLSG